MNKLTTLIRLNKWQVDQKSRVLSALQAEALRLEEKDRALSHELEQERQAATASLEAAASFGFYVQQALLRKRLLAVERARLETLINAARDELRAAMGETKKFEVAQSQAVARERQAQKAVEEKALDEIALDAFRRREGGT